MESPRAALSGPQQRAWTQPGPRAAPGVSQRYAAQFALCCLSLEIGTVAVGKTVGTARQQESGCTCSTTTEGNFKTGAVTNIGMCGFCGERRSDLDNLRHFPQGLPSGPSSTMPSICIPLRAPGGIPRFSAVVPVSSRGLTTGTCTDNRSHFWLASFLPPPPFFEAKKDEEKKKKQKRRYPKWPRVQGHSRTRARAQHCYAKHAALCALTKSCSDI